MGDSVSVLGRGKDGWAWIWACVNLRGEMDIISGWVDRTSGCSERDFLRAVAAERYVSNQSINIKIELGLVSDLSGMDVAVWAPVDRRARGTPCYDAAVAKASYVLGCEKVRHNWVDAPELVRFDDAAS